MDLSARLNGLRQHANRSEGHRGQTMGRGADKAAEDVNGKLKADMSGHQKDVTMRMEEDGRSGRRGEPHMRARFDRL